MIIQKTFEKWLQQFDRRLHIEKINTRFLDEKTGEEYTELNQEIEVLYLGNKRLISIPKGCKGAKGWSNINDKRGDQGYETKDGTQHRSLTGIGLTLLGRKIITSRQFVKHFTSPKNKEMLEKMQQKGFKT
jgi:hypothetical protein|tara:strand:- start:102 stop:494 length:393 start_codon:yes stop_codon:yes gene_type:complete